MNHRRRLQRRSRTIFWSQSYDKKREKRKELKQLITLMVSFKWRKKEKKRKIRNIICLLMSSAWKKQNIEGENPYPNSHADLRPQIHFEIAWMHHVDSGNDCCPSSIIKYVNLFLELFDRLRLSLPRINIIYERCYTSYN